MAQLYTLPLADEQATIELSGGKGASLARLSAAGLPVPDGFHITTAAYAQFVAECGLQEQILAAASATVPGLSETFEEASRRIVHLFELAGMPGEIAEAIRRGYAGLDGGDQPVAVRSSATAEDLPGMSFAGQQETYLNIQGETAVLDAIKRCWASLWTARAMEYRARNGIAPQEVSIAVLVQKLVPAEAAGVLFTANPLTWASDQVVINAAWGLGEAIVGGQVTPDSIVVNKLSGKIIERRLNQKVVMTVRTAQGTQEVPVPADLREKAVLNPAQAAELARIGVRIEDLYHQPMDIEWALSNGRFFILQARPITSLGVPIPPETGEWNESLAGDFLWTNANYGEAVPDVMTPCTWSLVQILLNHADMSLGPLRQYGIIGGRLYGNLSASASVAAAFGIGPKRFAGMVADGFGRLPQGVQIPTNRISTLRLLGEGLPVVVRQMLQSRKNLKGLAAFLTTQPDGCEALRAQIAKVADPHELAVLWEGQVAPFFLQACHMLAAAANQGGGALLFLRQKLQKLVGEADADALLTSSNSAGGPLSSLEPLLGLTRLASGGMDRETYGRRYGHRGPHELEVSTPRPAEDPDWIEDQLAGLRQATESAEVLIDHQGAARRAAFERLHVQFPRQEAGIRRQIGSWAKIAHEREAVRSEVIRAYGVLRAFVMQAGKLTGLGEDIFFLSIGEILSLLNGGQTTKASIPARRETYNRYNALPPYPGLIRGRFNPFQWAADPQRRRDFYDASTESHAPASTTITGFPGARGMVEGRVRVIMSAEQGNQLQPGEILVTTMTNVGWTPLFPRAAAVVTDVGAPLSHAAIVARELGIPAVVGCGNATMHLHTGDRVRVDGGMGTVEVLPG